MPAKSEIQLNMQELREIAAYSVECALRALPILERDMPGDTRPRAAIDAALAFARGGKRTAELRATGWAALEVAREASAPAAVEAARAASLAAAAAYLHPLYDANQLKHILGAAAHAARAAELDAGDDRSIGTENRDWAVRHAPSSVIAVLMRYSPAPSGGGRAGEILREIDVALRGSKQKHV